MRCAQFITNPSNNWSGTPIPGPEGLPSDRGKCAQVPHCARPSWLDCCDHAPISEGGFHLDASKTRFAQHGRNLAPRILLAFGPEQHDDIICGYCERPATVLIEQH